MRQSDLFIELQKGKSENSFFCELRVLNIVTLTGVKNPTFDLFGVNRLFVAFGSSRMTNSMIYGYF